MKTEQIIEDGIKYTVKLHENGYQRWFLDGQLHRVTGPAIIYGNEQHWYLHGQHHRIGGPAIIYSEGSEFWYYHDQKHRPDGPAIIYSDGSQEWYYHDQYIDVTSQKAFKQWLKLKVFK